MSSCCRNAAFSSRDQSCHFHVMTTKADKFCCNVVSNVMIKYINVVKATMLTRLKDQEGSPQVRSGQVILFHLENC